MNKKIKTLIEVDRSVWSQVKAYGALNDLGLSETLEILLTKILILQGYTIQTISEPKKQEEYRV